jgi:hypothetical protein
MQKRTIPEGAVLRKEEAGVKWYEKPVDNVNTEHYMEFDGRVVCGCWTGPRLMFLGLTKMTPEERENFAGVNDLICGIVCKIKHL